MIESFQIAPRVFVLKDDYNNCANLVLGDKKALLLDTCLGLDDIKSKVRELTNLPLIVINSHGHFDHIGGNHQFEQVYISPRDKVVFKNYTKETLEEWLKAITGSEFSLEEIYDPIFNTVDLNFDAFDLGNLECQVIKLAGHSMGSIGIFIPKLRVLLSGDALTPVMTLNFDNHGDYDDELETVKRVLNLNFDYYLSGHSEKPFPKNQVERLYNCLINSVGKRHQYYKYPGPPYSPGYFYADSVEDEPIGLILANNPNDQNK